MHTKKIAAAVAAAALALTACAPSDSTKTTTSDTHTATPVLESTTYAPAVEEYVEPEPEADLASEDNVDAAFNSVLDMQGLGGTPTERQVWARTMCTFLEEGNSWSQFLREIAVDPYTVIIPGLKSEDIPWVMGASVAGYCPEYRYIIDAAAGS